MKLRWLSVTMILFSLCGCADAPASQTQPATEEPAVTVCETEPAGLYQPESQLEQLTGGALKVFPLGKTEATALGFFGDDLLLEQQGTLLLLSGESRYISATVFLPGFQFQIYDRGVFCRNPDTGELIFLNRNLTETDTLQSPTGMSGAPVVSQDGKFLYYCTPNSLRVLDLITGLDRMLKEMAYPSQSLTGIHRDSTVLECAVTTRHGDRKQLYLSCADGALLDELPETASLCTFRDFYLCTCPSDGYTEILFGTDPQQPSVLETGYLTPEVYPISGLPGAILAGYDSEHDITNLDFYDLRTGSRSAAVTLPGNISPQRMVAEPSGTALWFVLPGAEARLCHWDLSRSSVNDPHSYRKNRFTRENPDTEGLLECQILASKIAEKHHIRLLIRADTPENPLWEHPITEEYRVPVLRQTLKALEEALDLYPPDFLKQAASETPSGRITISLVQSAVDDLSDLQGWDDAGDARIILTTTGNLSQTIHRELFHIFESRVFSVCAAYDQWQMLNPSDFVYGSHHTQPDNSLLTGPGRAFIDARSMTSPSEDRARIMEYALLSEEGDCFRSEIMQRKLRTLCLGLREAFSLTDYPGILPWEQHLDAPLQ